MGNRSYEFDPCSIDGSDKEEVTLDSWKPNSKKPEIVQSEWRKNQIADNNNQQPGLDDLKKIQMFLSQKKSDGEIMKVFGITAEMLVAIKKDKYSPVDGISLDNQSKIYKEFTRLETKILLLETALNFIADTIFFDKEAKKEFLKATKKATKGKKLPKKCRDEEEEE
jgi:hypothetical protein